MCRHRDGPGAAKRNGTQMANERVMKKVYTYADGTEGRSAKPGWTRINFQLISSVDEDKKVTVDRVISFEAGEFEKIRDCAIGHGLMQKIGDEVSGWRTKAEKAGKEPTLDFVESLIRDVADNLRAGVWVEEGEGNTGAGNVTILLDAIKAAYEKVGQPLSDEQITVFTAKLAEKAERDAIKAIPEVDVEVKRIIAERAQTRAKEAAKAMKGKEPSGLMGLLGATPAPAV